jgi:AbiV family abortive infection protein
MNIEARFAVAKKLAFENALRLFEDASLLFENNRYSSAFALAATCFEEVGKLHVVDRVCDSICLNPDSVGDFSSMSFCGPLLADHVHKQSTALFDALSLSTEERDRLIAWVSTGGLETERRIALYVELSAQSVDSPERVSKGKTGRLLKLCYDALLNSAELAFNGFDAMPSAKAEWQAAEGIKRVEVAMARCHDA